MADADIDGYTPPTWLHALKPILCGPATVDNLDYVPRDAYMCGISLGAVEVQRLIHYTFVSGDSIVLHAHAAGALEMFLASRLYMYLQVYHHRTGRRFDLSMREIFADTIAQLLHGNPLEHLDEYELLNDWSVLVAVQRWLREAPGSERRRLADAWARIAARDLPWHLAYESVVHKGMDTSTLQEQLDAQLASQHLGARVEVDVAIARIAPQNPMTDDGMVRIYDPLNDTIEAARAAELVARLPQHNQVIRVFTDDVSALRTVHDAVETVHRRLISRAASRGATGRRGPDGITGPAVGVEVLLAHLCGDVRRDVAEHLADRARRCGGHDRSPVAIGAADARVERHRAEERQLVAGGKVASTAGSEDVGALVAVRADESAHVLDDAEHRHVELAEHLDAAAHVGERHILRRRADDCPGHRHALREAQLHVARSRGQIDHEVVELAPRDFVEKLAQRLGEHRTAPDDRLTGIEDRAERHHLESVRLERLHLPVGTGVGTLADPEHDRDVGAVDVRVEQPDRALRRDAARSRR